MNKNIDENKTFTKYECLKIKSLKSKFDFDLLNIDKYFNPTFILNCYESFFSKFIYIISKVSKFSIEVFEENYLNEALKIINENDNLYFIFEKNSNDNYKFKFSYKKENKEIFYLTGVSKNNCLYEIEKFYTEEFFKLPNTKNLLFVETNLNFRRLKKKLFEEDFKVITKYDNDNNKNQLSKNIIFKETNYLLEDNIDKNLFNRLYFYNNELELKCIMYFLLKNENFIRIYYDLDKKIYKRTAKIPDIKDGVKNLSDICIDYLKRTNKKAEDINESDLSIISMINY